MKTRYYGQIDSDVPKDIANCVGGLAFAVELEYNLETACDLVELINAFLEKTKKVSESTTTDINSLD